MSVIGDRLRALADEVDRMAGTPQNAPAGVSGAPAPSNAPTPQSSPNKATPAVSQQVSLLADRAMAEALVLKGAGHNVAGVIQRIEGIQKAKTVKDVQNNVDMAIGELEPLQNRGVDVDKLREPLHEIEVLANAGETGVIIGENTDEAGKDMFV